MTATPSVGRAIPRVDGRAKVTGSAAYAVDLACGPPRQGGEVGGAQHAALVRSTVTTGRVLPLDVAAAEAVPGVTTVLTHENAPRLP